MNRKLTPKPNDLEYGVHRLTNKRTGKLASSSNWLVDLAAIALVHGHTNGIGSLLPLKKAAKLLKHNKLEPFRKQKTQVSGGHATAHVELRELAQKALPAIAAYYTVKVAPGIDPKHVNRKGFAAWIVKEMAMTKGGLNQHLLQSNEFNALAETERRARWWLDRLKMQSK